MQSHDVDNDASPLVNPATHWRNADLYVARTSVYTGDMGIPNSQIAAHTPD